MQATPRNPRMLKLLLLLLLPTEVSAFQFTQTFHFKNVPMEIGARHIHTPEHLETAFSVTLPKFKVSWVDFGLD